MWVHLWIAFSVSATVLSQQTSTRVMQAGAGYEWGWQLAGAGAGGPAVGHYYVKLPESEQRVEYSADGGGYRATVARNTSTHGSSLAFGHQPVELHNQPTNLHNQQQVDTQIYQNPAPHQNGNVPLDFYLLQQPNSAHIPRPQPFTILTSATNNLQLPNYLYNRLTPLYNLQTQHPIRNDESNIPGYQIQNDLKSDPRYPVRNDLLSDPQYPLNDKKREQNERSKPLNKEAQTEQTFVTPVVQVFKDHKCSDDTNPENTTQDLKSDLKKSKDLFAEVPSYELRNINGNFGAKKKNPFTYRGEVSFRVQMPQPNTRQERFYHTTIATPRALVYNATEEGINRLVASTQDLITNEDLLRINNAIEHHLKFQNDDLIKPRARFSEQIQNKNEQEVFDISPTTITVKAKIANILRGEIQHTENNPVSEHVLQSDSKNFKFMSPIVVAEEQNNNFSKQIFDNVVSTVVPYLANGYEVVDIKNGPQETQYNADDKNSYENPVDVTPRPIGSNYLAPITVALRLLNTNDNDTFNYIEDHEAADSEQVPEAVEIPNKEKTIVEVQESIPLSITHINDVEVHEYMDIGRSNINNKDAYQFAKSLYDNYKQSVRSSNKIQDNMNKILLYKFGETTDDENSYNDNHNSNDINDSKKQLEPSENIQSNVEIRPNGESTQRSELIYYNGEDDYGSETQKIIQPIVIEKEIPITKFVDRYIEKQVPYPETVTVPVPVDRPVPYPVEVEKVVEKPVEVTKYVDNPYPVEVSRPYPVKVPYPVEQKVYVDRPIGVPYPVEKVVEKEVVHPVPVPTPVGIPVEVPFPVERQILFPFPVDRPVPVRVEIEKPVEVIVEKEVAVPYMVEKRVPYPVPYETKVPVPYPVEKRVPVPVDRIVEKPVTVTQVVERPVHIKVPVPHPVPIHVHHSYPVDRIVEKKVPYPVHVDRIVEKKVNVPYPVEKIVEKIVEKPVVVTKYVDKPYPVEVKVPYPVEKIVEKKVPYPVHVPYEVKVPYHGENHNNYELAVKYHRYKPHEAYETRNHPQYQLLDQEQLKKKHYQSLKDQYEDYVKDSQKQKKASQAVPLQSTQWGNQYASSYQYINNAAQNITKPQDQKNQAFENYFFGYFINPQPKSLLTNFNQNLKQNQGQDLYSDQNQRLNQGQGRYDGQYQGQNEGQYQSSKDNAQAHSQNHNYWKTNQEYLEEPKVRRTDRVPKVTIEYGGFKPPLIPSTEIDLDGVPVNKSK